MIVADTNIVAYLLLPGEFTNLIEQVADRDKLWLAPALWRSEFRNVLALYLRQGSISFNEALFLIEKAEHLIKVTSRPSTSREVLELVNVSSCSAYDCEFIALAQWYDVPLLTMDRRILREFPNIALTPEQFLRS
ncbi:MAG: type II toxin-antitoxin system VapC family toxin [Ardenticatenaceae bacterium]|nr:type II toxin-antitoxin system VapC family toxin [Ardenticatenaceae bacterium]